ncbi:interferon-induced GTP-binding protein Mx [Diaporthe helianthi]|uniref:Interferon-induced GTP-binding protein Mx n=1 Tax=Diaporthe helianthi TaxID=158607 RepID=A0A2P5I1N7_DIAHE|nr:interferon-induced GTP-binding protein Mx [Diaporthe helianthi]
MSISPTLEDLQTDEQRRVLDTVSQVRNNDNLCTRFATEICLRRDPIDSLTIRVIPDSDRPQDEQEQIKNYFESIDDFKDLPKIMNNAMKVMGISEGGNAFAKDTLSIEICGPNRPQLTLVDIPGLIQTSTKGVSESDVALVAEITEHYIKQPRTICLAVIAATNDAANQPILQRVRKFDPNGNRTLGVITKPDKLSAGSGSESKFLELARNEDVFLKLGWHVVKNRKFEERDFSIDERKSSEMAFFSTSNFRTLAKDNVGIDALRLRLSYLLFEHVKQELPRLQTDLERALQMARDELKTLGNSRATPTECRAFLTQLSMECYDICRSTLNGNYDNPFFKCDAKKTNSNGRDKSDQLNKASSRRLRAAVQLLNCMFANAMDTKAQKYVFGTRVSNAEPGTSDPGTSDPGTSGPGTSGPGTSEPETPQVLSVEEAKYWAKQKLRLARGSELIGNFNPQVIGEMFWEQSEPWEVLANFHVQGISNLCKEFLLVLLDSQTTHELKDRIW